MIYTLEFVTSAPFMTEYFNYCASHKKFAPVLTKDLSEDEKEHQEATKGWLRGVLHHCASSCEVDVDIKNKFSFTGEFSFPPGISLGGMTENDEPLESILVRHAEKAIYHVVKGQTLVAFNVS